MLEHWEDVLRPKLGIGVGDDVGDVELLVRIAIVPHKLPEQHAHGCNLSAAVNTDLAQTGGDSRERRIRGTSTPSGTVRADKLAPAADIAAAHVI